MFYRITYLVETMTLYILILTEWKLSQVLLSSIDGHVKRRVFVDDPHPVDHQTSLCRPKMATNILSIPFRRTKPAPLIETLRSFISTTLDQHPEQFRDDLLALDRLRA